MKYITCADSSKIVKDITSTKYLACVFLGFHKVFLFLLHNSQDSVFTINVNRVLIHAVFNQETFKSMMFDYLFYPHIQV